MPPSSLDIGRRIRTLRTAQGMSGSDLARQAGDLSPSVLSTLENGRTSVAAETVENLARVLGCRADYLVRPLADQLVTQPRLRAYADAPKKAVDRYVADTRLAAETFELLSLPRLADRLPTFSDDVDDDDAIEEAATAARAAAQLEEGDVVGNMTRSAERLGCVVLPMDDELGRHLGLSLRVDETPMIRVARPGAERTLPGDRQRFTVAHELGHLVLHADTRPPETAVEARRAEQQAHRFAGAFLAPAEPLMEDLVSLGDRVTLTTLARLKERWGVAIKALVMRLSNLDRIDADQARSLYKQISAKKWTRQEPIEVGNETARWLDLALGRRLGDDPLPAAAAQTGLGVEYFEQWSTWWESPAPEAEVVEMRPRRGAGQSETANVEHPAGVHRLRSR